MAEQERAPVGAVAARAAGVLADGDVVVVLADEQRAEAVAAALTAAAPDARVLHFPSTDALPGEASAASPANTGRRVAALHAAFVARDQGQRVALIVTAEAAARLQAAPTAYDLTRPVVTVGDTLDAEGLAQTLLDLGYLADERVDEPGEMAVRGQTVDIFPADAELPVRLELADGRVVAIRRYDPVTQLSADTAECIELGRLCEPPLGKGVTVFDHLPDSTVLLDPGATERRDRYVALAKDAGGSEPVADAKRWDAALGTRALESLGAAEPVPRFVEARDPARAFARFAKGLDGETLVLVGAPRDLRFLSRRAAKLLGREADSVTSWTAVRAAPAGALLSLAMPADRGWREDGVVAVAAADLIGSRAAQDTAAPVADPFAHGLLDLRLGDVVVHEDFGLGAVAGLDPIDEGGDAIVLRYASDDRRLVPVVEADKLWRYGADDDAVTLDKLDGSSWQKRRGAIDAAVAESARELTRLAAGREQLTAPSLDPDAAKYEQFAAGFVFTETADQARAIAAVRADLASGKPMDRLVIGDVGYGKTEVALRAAALAALAGAQVAVTAPTTVLVRQHIETFTKRFKGTGIEVAGLSRLSSAADKKRVKAGLADGSIGVVVGTAAVAATGVTYHNLQLTIVDEEQRFGAADKAKLRGLGGEATHTLSLSATPIPRTLQTALVGLQQLSIIATPPARRQPIRTALAEWDDVTVRTALRREHGRGGQSFVVVSRIEDMAGMAERLKRLAPELTVVEAHGKLPVGDIDAAMVAFANGKGDVLLATNIIEAGLDVPRANTMIVWRADRFGLAQLHQLRGRVGRGSRRGQVMLLTDPAHPIAAATVKRLKTLEAFDRLGAGFAIAARDLDMRGAGDLVGDVQAGHIKLIGVDLYQFLLENALRTARGQAVERWTPELNVGLGGRWPETWVPEVETRISLYARLARITDAGALDAFADELEDRFGHAPPEAAALLDLARLRLLAADARIAKVDAGPAAIALTPRRDFGGDAAAAGLAEKNGRLLLAERIEDPEQRLARVREVLEALTA